MITLLFCALLFVFQRVGISPGDFAWAFLLIALVCLVLDALLFAFAITEMAESRKPYDPRILAALNPRDMGAN
jgi:hypothetical protein